MGRGTRGKAEANRRKHHVSFELARRIFDDPLTLSRPDGHPDGDRWQSLGRPSAGSEVVLLVVHTEAHHFRPQGDRA
ncbi:BrnT family toxin [Roseomonas sp. CCTCC AB2023176]|uniref:BrnT family toxin n=1 Tax=Roseomonas sp. CCTCC AB2023176 TaxID=3342640 RepID=UPI0035DDBF99